MTTATPALRMDLVSSYSVPHDGGKSEMRFGFARRDSIQPVSTSTDLLTQVINQLRPHLARCIPAPERIKTFWAVALESQDLAASDVVVDDFLPVAAETGLIADLGRHGVEDCRHVIRWAMRGVNPFGKQQT
jgi:hypothetical protein